MTPAATVRGLRKSYRNVRAIDGIDLTIERGEVFALLGPNGAGKTTTVEILEGHRKRDGGDVSVLGVDPGTAGGAWRARIGIVLQSATDAAELTVAGIVRHVAGYYPSPRDPGEVTAPATVIWRDGDRTHSEQTQKPTELVLHLASRGCEVNDLQVTRPSLEDIYLELIGAPA